ncbi:MAG TPA: hypothetical protein VF476_07905, partial [Chitinophagaceae bacterium]
MLSKKYVVLMAFVAMIFTLVVAFRPGEDAAAYISAYTNRLQKFKGSEEQLLAIIKNSDLQNDKDKLAIKEQIQLCRNNLKGLDFWFRYMEPIAYKKINGPLPVEWETEVFEKFEKP